jgi:hypothetical protein
LLNISIKNAKPSIPKTNLEKPFHSCGEKFQLQSDRKPYVINATIKNVGSNDNTLTNRD